MDVFVSDRLTSDASSLLLALLLPLLLANML
jgi:hypothetical protein